MSGKKRGVRQGRRMPVAVTPDVLTFSDGSAVDAAGWPRRRRELQELIIPHEYEGLPPADVRTETLLRSRGRVRALPGAVSRTVEVRVTFADGREFGMTLTLWIPPGTGPFPVVLDGDGCWRTFNDAVVHEVLSRGNIAASFDRTQAAADNKDRYRETGLFRLLPDASFGVLGAWAWAYHRCVDALTAMPEVRADAIAITGHSRGGKTVLLAGATDERIALTNPNGSGIGGASLHRLKAPGSERVDSFFRSGNIFWFGRAFADYRHRDAELPYDQHFLSALVAPRLLLVTDAYEDFGANPPGAYAACQAVRAVYNLLGAPESIGWNVREGDHAHRPADYEALLDFMDRHFHGREVVREFQRPLFPDLNLKPADAGETPA